MMTSPARSRAPLPWFEGRPVLRRIVNAVVFEALAILCATLIMGAALGHGSTSSFITAVSVSATAIVWNYLWNWVFEFFERRLGLKGRKPLVRVVHAAGFEATLAAVSTPLVAWLLTVSLWEALLIQTGLLVFFLVFTYAYAWAFDRVFGLPASAR